MTQKRFVARTHEFSSGGSPEIIKLDSGSRELKVGAVILASSGNSGDIWLGDNAADVIAQSGFPLYPGAAVNIDIDMHEDSPRVYAAGADGDKIHYWGN